MNIPVDFLPIGHMGGGAPQSPLEALFVEAFEKYKAPDCSCTLQRQCHTPLGPFRVDVHLVSTWGRKVAVELDGQAFHDLDRDTVRDASLIRAGHVTRVIRIAGKYMYRYREHAMWLLSQMEPWAFSERGRQVLAHQMRAEGVSDEIPWSNGAVTSMDFNIPLDDRRRFAPYDDDDETDMQEPEHVLFYDHDSRNPFIVRASELIEQNPRWSLARLTAQLKSPT